MTSRRQFSHYVVAVAVVFLVQLAALWLRHRTALKRCSCWSVANEKLSVLKQWLCNRSPQPEQDEFLQRMDACMDEQCVNFALNFCRWMWAWTNLLLIIKTARLYVGVNEWTTLGLDVLWLGASILFAVIFWFPSVMNVKSTPWWGTVFMMFAVASPWVTPLEFWSLLSTLFAIFRVAFGMMFRHMRHVVFWNLLLLLSCILARIYEASDCPYVPSLATVFVWEGCTFGSLMVGINGLKELLTAKARLTIQAQRAEEERSAATVLLESMSDAVVQLDAKLEIIGAASKFASLLIIPKRSLHGKPFETFVAENERKHFASNMMNQSTETATTTANMFHVTLQDSWRNCIRAQVFHVCFASTGNCALDGRRHLVGVKEFGDEVQRRPISVDTNDAKLPHFEPCSAVREVCPQQVRGNIDIVDMLTVTFDPYNNLVRQTLRGFPPREQVPLPCLHFWGQVIDGQTPAHETFSMCVDLFARHASSLVKVTYRQDIVIRAKSPAGGAQGPPVECQMALARCDMDISEDADGGAGFMALAILKPHSRSNTGLGMDVGIREPNLGNNKSTSDSTSRQEALPSERVSSMALAAGTLGGNSPVQTVGRDKQHGGGPVVVVIEPTTGLVLEAVPGILKARNSQSEATEIWGGLLEVDELMQSAWETFVQFFLQRIEVHALELDFGPVRLVNPDLSSLLVRGAACQIKLTRCDPKASREGQEIGRTNAILTLSPCGGNASRWGSNRTSGSSSSSSSGNRSAVSHCKPKW